MGLMYSNAVAAKCRASIRRKRREQAAREGIDVTDRAAFREWESRKLRELCDGILQRSRKDG